MTNIAKRSGFTIVNVYIIVPALCIEALLVLVAMPWIVKLVSATIYFIVYALTSAVLGRLSGYAANKITGRMSVSYIELTRALSLARDGWIRETDLAMLPTENLVKPDLASSLLIDGIKNVVFLGFQFIILIIIWQVSIRYFVIA